MAVRENVSFNSLTLCHEGAISTNTTTTTAIIDTANFDLGVTFLAAATAYTDGTYKLTFTEGDNSALSDGTTVGSEKLVIVGTDAVSTGVTAATADGSDYLRVGVHSTKRYVRANVVSTGVTSGATLSVLCLKSGEVLPQ